MRVVLRVALIVVVALSFSAPLLHADLQADCPLTLVSNNRRSVTSAFRLMASSAPDRSSTSCAARRCRPTT